MTSIRTRMLACFLLAFAACGDDAASMDHGGGGAGSGGAGTGGGIDDRGLDACFADLAAPASGFVEVQSFATEDGAIRIRRARQPGTRSAVGETFAYDLVRFAIESDDETACVTRSAQLAYEFGHHNWSERWEARTERARYAVREELDVLALSDPNPENPWMDTLEAFALDSGDALLTARPLVAEGCYSLPYDYNPCFRRMRTDQPPAGGDDE